MIAKLDKKDCRLLFALDQNSRAPNTQIAKQIGVSSQVTGQRIRRLIQKNILTKFHTVINIAKLGFTNHKCYIKLQNIDIKKEKELIAYLQKHDHIAWLASCDGAFDLVFAVWAKDIFSLNNTLKEINQEFGECISERRITSILLGEFHPRAYLGEEMEKNMKPAFFGGEFLPVHLDTIDYKLLSILAKNSRTQAIQIEKQLEIGVDAIGRRIKKLEKSGVISNYTIVPNEEVYPFLHYKILIRFRNVSEEKEKLLKEYCKNNPNIVYTVRGFGEWDFEIDIEVPTVAQKKEIIMNLKSKFTELIKDYSVLEINKVHKYNLCPGTEENILSNNS